MGTVKNIMAAIVTHTDYGCAKTDNTLEGFLYTCQHYTVTNPDGFPYYGYVIILFVFCLMLFGFMVGSIYAEKARVNEKLDIDDELNPENIPEFDRPKQDAQASI